MARSICCKSDRGRLLRLRSSDPPWSLQHAVPRTMETSLLRKLHRSAGVDGPQILMRDRSGLAVMFTRTRKRALEYEGYDPTARDANGNRIGDPTGRTHGALFFDYDDDGDPDLWVANDGDRLQVYRNDSTQSGIKFTRVGRYMGIDKVGNWMGFGIGDYDGDADLDVVVTNVGYHIRTQTSIG